MTHLKNIKIALFVFIILLSFAGCKSNNKPETRDIQLLTDSSAYNNNTFSDTSTKTEANAIPPKVNTTGTHHSTSTRTTSTGGSGTTSSNSGTVSNSGSTSTTSTTTQKKGWSKAAQGAVIGGVGGAIGGAIISKKKGTGAVVGGVIGAAGGYIIGRSKDKKDGRVQ